MLPGVILCFTKAGPRRGGAEGYDSQSGEAHVGARAGGWRGHTGETRRACVTLLALPCRMCHAECVACDAARVVLDSVNPTSAVHGESSILVYLPKLDDVGVLKGKGS